MDADRKRRVKERLRAVEGILREWNPIGFPVPPDEYDAHAPALVLQVEWGSFPGNPVNPT